MDSATLLPPSVGRRSTAAVTPLAASVAVPWEVGTAPPQGVVRARLHGALGDAEDPRGLRDRTVPVVQLDDHGAVLDADGREGVGDLPGREHALVRRLVGRALTRMDQLDLVRSGPTAPL